MVLFVRYITGDVCTLNVESVLVVKTNSKNFPLV